MTKQFFFITLALLLFSTSISAQTLETETLKDFNPAVQRKVYDVAKYVKLTPTQQSALAKAFEREDADFIAMIHSNGGMLSVKDSRKADKNHDTTLAAILSPEELQQYYRGVYDPEANAEGISIADDLQRKYNLTDQNWKFIRIAFYKIGLESRVINKTMADQPAKAKKKIAELRKQQLATIEEKGGIRVNDDMTVTVTRPFNPNTLRRK